MYKALSKLFSLVTVSLSLIYIDAVAESSIIPSPIAPPATNSSDYAPNEVIAILSEKAITEDNITIFDIFESKIKNHLREGTYSIQNYPQLNMIHITSSYKTTAELTKILQRHDLSDEVNSIYPNSIFSLYETSDSYYDKLWSIENRSQEVNGKSGTTDADMDLDEAWKMTKGSTDVVVAILDTGVDYTHNDLADNMWNGLPNHGYDFAGDNNGTDDDDPMPDMPYSENGHYHGTAVAGTVGAVGDNAEGISGVAQHLSIMALKVFRPNGQGYSSDILEALDFISKQIADGVNIVAINASYGSSSGSANDPTSQAIKKLGEQGVLFCSAVGNGSKNIDNAPIYPSSYPIDSILAVGASDQDDNLANFSNYGKVSVDLVAPATNILTTYPDNQYTYLNGTSMATPQVTGAVALVASLYPSSTVAERREMILNGVEKKESFTNIIATGGRININMVLSKDSTTEEQIDEVEDNNDTSTEEEPTVQDDSEFFFGEDQDSFFVDYEPSSFGSSFGSSPALLIESNGESDSPWRATPTGYIKEEGDKRISVERHSNGTIKKYSVQIGDLQSEVSIKERGSIEKISDEDVAIIKLSTTKDAYLKITESGRIRLKIDGAIVPIESMPLGTKIDVDGEVIRVTVSPSDPIKF